MTVFRQSVQQADPQPLPRDSLPTMYDLPSEDPEEPGLPDEFHLWQPQLCSATFQPPNYPSEQVFVASDLNLYYDVNHTGWYKRPDWFAVVGGSRFYDQRDLRLSYVIWQEQISPTVVIELLSPGTRDEDLGKREQRGLQPTKWHVYEQILKIPYYILFDRYTDELQVWQWVNGYYQPQILAEPRIWLPSLCLGLGLWQGEFQGLSRQWLRWYDQNDTWILLDVEKERLRAEQERLRAERLAERLRLAGIDPDDY